MDTYETFSPGTKPDELLARQLQYVKGVGPKRATLLQRLQLLTIQDLLFHFPFTHKDRASVTPIREVKAGSDFNIVAQIIDVRGKRFGGGKEKIEALLQDESGQLRAGWWNPYVLSRLTPNAWAFFSGKVARTQTSARELTSPEFELLSADDDEDRSAPTATGPNFGRIVPIYNLRPKQRLPDGTEAPEIKMTQKFLRQIVWQAIGAGAADRLVDQLPEYLRKKLGLLPLSEALRQIHFPDNFDLAGEARWRLAFEELFIIALGVALRRMQVERLAAPQRLPLTPAVEKRILARLPFQLTPGQKQSFQEIAKDMAGAHPMNRLLQGDVGSGKTAIAVSALLLTVAHGGQAALLAPTEVLAEQHFRTLTQWLAGSRVNIALLRGGMKEKERAEYLERLSNGEIHIAVGTHALLEPGVKFKNMALVVIDEQHKFGVEQRRSLRAKGRSPHMLVMTATPIPRTMTLTLYGDLDVSVLSEPPPGRAEIVTRWIGETEREKLYRLIITEARKGHATYVVLPRIDEDSFETNSGALIETKKPKRTPKSLWNEVKGAEEEFKRLKEHLPTLRIELLHGRMSSEEKDQVLTKLRAGKIDILVSTQVIEVGIDLPTATIMVIENAERFGLSALHQLRGRVGRSGRKSYCLIFGATTTPEAEERLKTFVKTRDGFELAEADFILRGPGQFFGTAQSGLPELRIADLVKDSKLLALARNEAMLLVRGDSQLAKPEHAGLKARVREVLGKKLGLVDVG